jgi:hypothetical protein
VSVKREGFSVLSRTIVKKQRGRRVATTLAAVGLLVGTLVLNGTALAVHDEGVFQLDGNAITSPAVSGENNPGSNTTGAHDWSQVYQDRNAGTPAGSGPFPNSLAVAQSFITDVTGAGDSIFTGGSTKDIYDLPSWLWKQTAVTSVQDKDDIEHAFAAQYSVDKSGGQCGTVGPQNPCVLLYFGADRFANSGSTTMGFWFFKSKVEALGPAATGTFSGTHTARSVTGHGDILILSDFLIGGAAPAVSVYEWVDTGGSASTHLDLIGGGVATLASCTAAPPVKKNGASVPPVSANDNLCATTNQNVLTSPWPFTAKTGETGQQVSELMEGGINMTALGLGNECFNSFLAETRASPSPTSTLSDFALGHFGSCGATAVTTPSADTGAGAVAPGTDVTDHFVVTGTSSGGTAPYPTSATAQGGHNVFFSYCGPMLVTDTTGTCSGGDAAHTAGASFDNEALANTATQGVSDATSSAINTSGNPLAPGRYCFVGSWAGDNNYTDGASDSSVGECFVVRILQPNLTTAQRFVPNDSATVTVASGAGDLAGTLRFQLFVNSTTCGGTAAYDSGAINITTGTGTGLSRTLSSSNSTAYSTNGTTFSWLVTYTSTNSGQNGVTAACNAENSSINIDNGGTFNTP